MTSDETTLRIERIIDAPPEAVFKAWTTKEALEQWYADGDDAVATVTDLDVRVGGAYRIEWGPKGKRPFVENGTYVEIVPPRLLVMSETLLGPEIDGWIDTKVSVHFEDHAGKTKLTLVHENFPSRTARDDASHGWPGFIDRIEKLVTGG